MNMTNDISMALLGCCSQVAAKFPLFLSRHVLQDGGFVGMVANVSKPLAVHSFAQDQARATELKKATSLKLND